MKKIFTLSCCMLFLSITKFHAQTNLNFENWSGNEPNNWTSSNSLTQPNGGAQTVFKVSTDPAEGSFSVKMVTGSCPDCPEFAIFGPFGPTTPLPDPLGGSIQLGSIENPGIPYTQRPTSVDFRYKANPATNDACGFQVELTRFNPATEEDETIGEGYFEASSDVNIWTTVNIPIVYYSDLTPERLNIWATSSIGSIPDLSAFGFPDLPVPTPVAGSEFQVDAIVLNLPSCDGFTISMGGSSESSLGALDGTATVTPSGGTAPYTYSWSNLENTQTITNLIPGYYVVTVTDANQCQKVGTYYVAPGGCNLSLSISGTNSSSNSIYTGNGSATVSVTGGDGPFSYQWNTGATGTSINNLAVGTYAVLVTEQDDPLCAAWAYYTVYGPDGPPISVEQEMIENRPLNMYPNPTTGLFNIRSDRKIVEVTIHNIVGQQVYQSNGNSEFLNVDMSAMGSGVYNCTVRLETGEVIIDQVVVD